MAANFLAAWRVPIKITSEALDRFNKLPAQLRLKRQSSNLSNSNSCNEGLYDFFFYKIDFFNQHFFFYLQVKVP